MWLRTPGSHDLIAHFLREGDIHQMVAVNVPISRLPIPTPAAAEAGDEYKCGSRLNIVVMVFVIRSLAALTLTLNPLLLKLRLIQLRIQPIQRQQIFVRAALDDLPAVHHQDQIRSQDGAQAVGDDDAGAPGHHPF